MTLNGRRVSTFATFIRNTDPGSVAGVPGISLPAGLTQDGLPVGLALEGLPGADRRLLSIAAAVEMLLPPLPAPRLGAPGANRTRVGPGGALTWRPFSQGRRPPGWRPPVWDQGSVWPPPTTPHPAESVNGVSASPSRTTRPANMPVGS